MDQFLITRATAPTLERQKAELEQQIKDLKDKLDLISRQLEAIPLFLSHTRNGGDHVSARGEAERPEVKDGPPKPEESPPPLPSLPLAVEQVLSRAGERLSALEIREGLIKLGVAPEKFGATNSYVYTVLGRLVARGRILRIRDKYQLPPGAPRRHDENVT